MARSIMDLISSAAENFGLPNLVQAMPALAPVANSIGLTKTKFVEPEYANNVDLDNRQDFNFEIQNPLYGFPKSTIPTDLPQSMKVYRADPTGKFGGKEGLETQPLSQFLTGGQFVGNTQIYKPNTNTSTSSTYDDPSKAIQDIYRFARLNGAAQKHGYPYLNAEDFAAFVLKEGRSDAGFNAVRGTPADEKFKEKLKQEHYISNRDLNYLSALNSKQRVADRLNIPFAMAWNGTGVNAAGQSGKDYAKDWEIHKKAAQNSKNQQLLELINRGMEEGNKYGLTSRKEKEKLMQGTTEKVPYKKGGNVAKSIEGGKKII
jgi:hypothetical protein